MAFPPLIIQWWAEGTRMRALAQPFTLPQLTAAFTSSNADFLCKAGKDDDKIFLRKHLSCRSLLSDPEEQYLSVPWSCLSVTAGAVGVLGSGCSCQP